MTTPAAGQPGEVIASVQPDQIVPPVTPPEDGGSPLDVELPQQNVFGRAYVEKIRSEAAGYRTKLREYESIGDKEKLSRAVRIAEALETDDGITQMFAETGQALGIGMDRLQSLFADDVKEAVAVAEEQKDAPLTRAELDKVIAERVIQPLEQQAAEREFADNQEAIDRALDALGVADQQDRYDVLSYGNWFVDEGASKAELVAAVRQGHAEWQKRIDHHVQRYVSEKAKKGSTLPTALTGSGPVTGEQRPEPQSVREASQRLRERGY